MSRDVQVGSARIYEFPLGRVRAVAQMAKPALQPRPAALTPQTTGTDFGSGWYHEAAIEEEARRKAKP